MASSVQTSLGKADTAYQVPSGGIPSSDMASAVQTSLGKADSAYQKPESGIPASDIASGVIPVLTDLIDDTAGDGDTNKVWSADKTAEEVTSLSSAIAPLEPAAVAGDVGKFLKVKTVADGKVTAYEFGAAGGGGSIDLFYVTPEDYGAVGDGETDDSQAVQDACDAGYAVYFASNKTYYLASAVTIDHDCHLFGGKGATIKTATPSGGTAPNGIIVSGTLKKTTTLTSNYLAYGSSSSDNAGNKIKLTDMTDIAIGDVIVIRAEDQYYSYSRQYYYLGGTLMVTEKDSNHLYVSDSMPWDIENTEDVTVEVYDAPVAIIENLNFISDNDTSGEYIYCVSLYYCKNSTVKNCSITEMDNGFGIYKCVNTMIDCVNVSESSGASESPLKDHYGIAVYSCSNTNISRVLSQCANACVELSGDIPNMNTYIKNCNLYGSNRVDGLGMHDNAYNTVVEDCVIGGMTAYGTMSINRCRFTQRFKLADSFSAITYRGVLNPDWSKLTVTNCILEDDTLQISIAKPGVQTPIQAYDSVIGEIVIKDCEGGSLNYIPGTDSTILSNRIKRLVLENWTDCYEIYHTSGSTIDYMIVQNCTFKNTRWMNSHDSNFCFSGVEYLRLIGENPKQNRLFVDLKKNGARYILPEGVSISLSSSNTSAHYTLCGNNIGSNDTDDYSVGSVSGSVGGQLTRTVTSGRTTDLSVDSNGNLKCVIPGTSVITYYLKGMAYVDEESMAYISCKLKNTGTTDAASFRVSIAVLDADTLNIRSIGQATATSATSQGASTSYNKIVPKDSLVQFYIYCNNHVANAETTFEELNMNIVPLEIGELPYEAYNGAERDGDGTLTSISGVNRVMCSDQTFTTNFKADFLPQMFATIPSAVGVNF